jgi:hypothetical protein
LLILKSEERQIEVERKKMRDVNVGDRERERCGMRVEDLERKKSVGREREKGERERETYERIQGMRKKKVKKNNYLQVEFLGQYILFLLMLKSGEIEILKWGEKR